MTKNSAWNCPAMRVAKPHKHTLTQTYLAGSLACYVAEEDRDLARREFLRNVIDRIEMDLRDNTQ